MGPGSDPESSLLTRFDADPPAAEISRSSLRPCALAAAATVALLLVALLVAAGQWAPQSVPPISRPVSAKSAGPCVPPICRGVSTKSAGPVLRSETDPYPWTNAMLDWQRTVFHFQPQKNWMNDPNAPLYYKGWYHLFYQYNPHSAVWGTGNLSWGHAVSRDLVHWRHLPLAMVPDHLYDANGVWSGSATLLPRGGPHRAHIVILYTGITTDWAQVQNLAEPADPSDPLLLNWAKSDLNPVLLPSPGIEPRNFRDPSTAWPVGARSAWRVAIGSMNGLLVYETKDFHSYELLPGQLHKVAGTGMWECIDFYPIPTREGVKHVLKASLYDHNKDYYAIGVYDVDRDVWVPDDVDADVGMGLMVDYGKYYASKTFYDEVKGRRVLLGWINETDSQRTDLLKGWASVQAIPRTVMYDERTRHNLLLWPVEEVESLRLSSREFSNIALGPGLVMPLDVHEAGQVDITAEFEIESSALAQTIEVDDGYNCNSSGGAAGRGALGPFGLLVLADEDRTEQTAVYFYVGRGSDGGLRTFFCQDELRRELCFVSVLVCTFGDASSVKLRIYNYFIYCRSSEANDLTKSVYGSTVPVLNGENLSVRVLVDHSIVESFAQGGRTCISSRVYPTKAIYGAARVFLFNNATGAQVTAKSVEICQMNSASIGPYTPQVL